jgi:hypothetical protein
MRRPTTSPTHDHSPRKYEQMNHVRFISGAGIVLVIFCISSAYWLPLTAFSNDINAKDVEGAKMALTLLKDSTIWMAGIQTATIASLGFLAKDSLVTFNPSRTLVRLALLVALFNTLALFCSAWILTALPSLSLRIYTVTFTSYDFFNYPLYGYMENVEWLRVFTLHFFAFWNHWFWAIGILLFGALGAAIFLSRRGA